MKLRRLKLSVSAMTLLTAAVALTSSAWAEDKKVGADKPEESMIVVTGVARPANKIDTSVSVSTLSAVSLENNITRGTSEVFRALPGIRSESSAGGGNSNLGVRGIPVSTGGAKWVQIQEDGLPVMLFGDFDFAPADGFYKVDSTLDHVEAVRGGSASTLTTGGPGAVLNMISKTGKKEGGSIAVETGVSYRNFRIDGNYGGHLSADTYFNIGGHYESGGDFRHIGYNGVEGGQVKATLTKEFGDGNFVRVWAKFLDKKDATYMPQAMRICNGKSAVVAGGSSGTVCGSVPGLDARNALNSPYLNSFLAIENRQVVKEDGSEGFHTVSQSFGGEASFDVGNGFRLSDKFKYAAISGNFEAPFTNSVTDADTLLATAAFTGHAATIFNGPNKGVTVNNANLTRLYGNAYISDVALFNTKLNDLGNFANDMKLQRNFQTDGGSFDLTLGYFHMTQNFKENWLWQDVMTTTGTGAALIDIAGVTQNGQYGFNTGFNWQGANRNIDLKFTTDSPYVAGTWKMGDLTLDGSVRHDSFRENGNITEGGPGQFDVNGDGVLSAAEKNVSLNQGLATIGYFNFTVGHTSYSFGANYKLKPDLAIFARYSNGAAYNGERQDGSGAYNPASGALLVAEQFVDVVKQTEVGVKWQTRTFLPGKLDLASTYFNTDTEESTTDTTHVPPTAFNITYKSYGIENEAIWRVGGFTFNGGATWTHARITSGPNKGNTPRRQADWVYNLNAAYSFATVDVGVNINGTTKSYMGMTNYFTMPAYHVVGAYVNWHLSDHLVASINGNNIFNAYGITEGEEDAGRYWKNGGSTTFNTTSARSIAGRSVSARLKYSF